MFLLIYVAKELRGRITKGTNVVYKLELDSCAAQSANTDLLCEKWLCTFEDCFEWNNCVKRGKKGVFFLSI